MNLMKIALHGILYCLCIQLVHGDTLQAAEKHKELNTQLVCSITPNVDINTIKALLERKAEVNAKFNSLTALHLSSCHDRADLVQLLLNNQANIDEQDGSDWTALHLSTVHCHVTVVQLLLANKADIYKPRGDGGTALHIASIGHSKNNQLSQLSLQICQLLINHERTMHAIAHKKFYHSIGEFVPFPEVLINIIGSYVLEKNNDIINQQNNSGKTALYYAMEFDNCDAMRILLQHKADPSIKTKENKSIFDLPFSKETLQVMQEFFPTFQQGNV